MFFYYTVVSSKLYLHVFGDFFPLVVYIYSFSPFPFSLPLHLFSFPLPHFSSSPHTMYDSSYLFFQLMWLQYFHEIICNLKLQVQRMPCQKIEKLRGFNLYFKTCMKVELLINSLCSLYYRAKSLGFSQDIYLNKHPKTHVFEIIICNVSLVMVAHLGGRGSQISVHLRPVWATKLVPGQPRLCSGILLEKKKRKKYKIKEKNINKYKKRKKYKIKNKRKQKRKKYSREFIFLYIIVNAFKYQVVNSDTYIAPSKNYIVKYITVY